MGRLGSCSRSLRLSDARSIDQQAISSSVRLQPSHQPVVCSIRQIPVQGLGGWCIARKMHWQPVMASTKLHQAIHGKGKVGTELLDIMHDNG